MRKTAHMDYIEDVYTVFISNCIFTLNILFKSLDHFSFMRQIVKINL